ncbi:MAG: hypothetical protein Q7S33_01210 [Nanoarchaeota archaeon]|nr:hypothetical protein [Nanoarchaeota archaeon]
MKIKIKGVAIDAKECKSIWSKFSGLMFRKTSPPLLFVFNKEKTLSIHSLFCMPFIAVWLNKNKKPTKIIEVKKTMFNISGKGMYLLEIAESDKSNYKKILSSL